MTDEELIEKMAEAIDNARVAELEHEPYGQTERTDADELTALFEMQHRREIEAIERWRAEDPEARDLTLPAYGRLLDWLWDKVKAERTAEVEALVKAANTYRQDAHWTNGLALLTALKPFERTVGSTDDD